MFTLSCGNSISKKDLCKNVQNAFLEKLKLKIDEFFHNQVNGKEIVIDISTVMHDCSGRHRLAGKLKKPSIQNLSCLIPFMDCSEAAKPGWQWPLGMLGQRVPRECSGKWRYLNVLFIWSLCVCFLCMSTGMHMP